MKTTDDESRHSASDGDCVIWKKSLISSGLNFDPASHSTSYPPPPAIQPRLQPWDPQTSPFRIQIMCHRHHRLVESSLTSTPVAEDLCC